MTSDRIWLASALPFFCVFIFAIATTIGAFMGGLWAALGIAGALLMLAAVWRIDNRPPTPDRIMTGLALIALMVFATLNLNSTEMKTSWAVWGQLVTIFLPLSLLASPTLKSHLTMPVWFRRLPMLAACAAAALGSELMLGGPVLKMLAGPDAELYRYDRGFSHLVVFALPLMALLWNSPQRWLLAPFVLLIFFPACYTDSRASKLAYILALLTTGVAFVFPVLVKRALFLAPPLAVLWPFVAQNIFLHHQDIVARLPPSWQHRVEIWDYMGYRIAEKPLLGWGLGTGRLLPFAEPHGLLYKHVLTQASHPHNAAIQLWVELGVPGLLLGLLFAFETIRRLGRLDRSLVPFACGAWVGAFCFAMISYNFWSDSLWALFVLTGLAFAVQQKQLAPGRPV